MGQKWECSLQFILKHYVAHFLFVTWVEALEPQTNCVPGMVQVLYAVTSPVHPHNVGNINSGVNVTFFFLLV